MSQQPFVTVLTEYLLLTEVDTGEHGTAPEPRESDRDRGTAIKWLPRCLRASNGLRAPLTPARLTLTCSTNKRPASNA